MLVKEIKVNDYLTKSNLQQATMLLILILDAHMVANIVMLLLWKDLQGIKKIGEILLILNYVIKKSI